MDTTDDKAQEAPLAYTATVQDVADHFGVHFNTVHRWLKSAAPLPHRRISGTIRFNLAEVDEWSARGGRPAEEVA